MSYFNLNASLFKSLVIKFITPGIFKAVKIDGRPTGMNYYHHLNNGIDRGCNWGLTNAGHNFRRLRENRMLALPTVCGAYPGKFCAWRAGVAMDNFSASVQVVAR
jgi:hypothetical protein